MFPSFSARTMFTQRVFTILFIQGPFPFFGVPYSPARIRRFASHPDGPPPPQLRMGALFQRKPPPPSFQSGTPPALSPSLVSGPFPSIQIFFWAGKIPPPSAFVDTRSPFEGSCSRRVSFFFSPFFADLFPFHSFPLLWFSLKPHKTPTRFVLKNMWVFRGHLHPFSWGPFFSFNPFFFPPSSFSETVLFLPPTHRANGS